MGTKVCIELGPTAVEFRKGSQIRVQVCSAAHPRWMRNLCNSQGTGYAALVSLWLDNESCRLDLDVDTAP